jgi:hypothetical protein
MRVRMRMWMVRMKGTVMGRMSMMVSEQARGRVEAQNV